MTVVIDPGHGGHDSGAVGPTGLKESGVNLRVSLSVGSLLVRAGIPVSYTRTDDRFVAINARWKQANKEDADYFVSIHCNSDGPSAEGIETLVEENRGESYELALLVQNQLIKVTDERDRGIKARPDLGVLAGTEMTAILVEIGFISNAKTEAKLRTNDYVQRIVEALADGIALHLGVTG